MADDAARRALKERQRERLLSDIARQKDQLLKDNQVRTSSDRFVSQHHDVDAQLKIDTIGLVNLDQYRSIRDQLELKRKLDQDAAANSSSYNSSPKLGKKKKKRSTINTTTLSFDEDAVDLLTESSGLSKKKTTKDPSVNTSFLPDRDREEEERRERERLRQDWLAKQELIKQQEIVIEFSYWDGNGHRSKVICKQGDTILHFLEKARQQFPDLRGVAADNLIFVKEDIVLPHHLDFYSLIINKVRGKSGPLFDFLIHDDVRLVNDATQEIVESHPGKVCQRAWYERNKHIFPASRWELFDPDKQYAQGGYTFSDRGKRGSKS